MAKYDTKEFFAELAEEAAKLRRDIEARANKLDAAGTGARRKRVLSGDFRFFAYTYFPHHIFGEPSEFQVSFCDRFPKLLIAKGGCKEWWIAPRGECKSSLLTKIGPVFIAVLQLLQRPAIRKEVGWTGEKPPNLDYGILLGAETSLPCKLVEAVKTELENNPSLAMDFPEAVGRTKVWRAGEIVTKTGVKIEARGAEQAIRGTFHGASRPSWLFGDDLITDQEAKSPTERDNRWNWYTKSVEYLGPPDGSVKALNVGTMLHGDDPLARAKREPGHLVHHFKALIRLPDRMDLWEACEAVMRNEDKPAEEAAASEGRLLETSELPSYHFYLSHQGEMDAGAKTSWPKVRSLYTLMRRRLNRKSFDTEMQGEPKSEEDRVFAGWKFFVSRLNHWTMLGACDPSMGKSEKADPSSIIAGGWDARKLKLHILACEVKRRVPSKLEADLIDWQREYRFQRVGFENNNAYEAMRINLREAGLRAGVPLPLVGLTTDVDMMVMIEGLEPFICDAMDPRILFDPGVLHLFEEMRDFPENMRPRHHYDGLSSLYLLWRLANSKSQQVYQTARFSWL